MRLFAQGDLLFERIDNGVDFTQSSAQLEGVPLVLTDGEKSGHRQALHGPSTLSRPSQTSSTDAA
jgi:hypothetical protein